MKKLIAAWLLLGVFLVGCTPAQTDLDQIFRSDTVVNIPVHPEETAAPTEITVSEETEEAVEPTQPVQEETAAPTTGGSKPSSGSRPSASGGKVSSAAQVTETKPPEAQPSETEPPATEAPEAAVYDISGYAPGSLEYRVAEHINTYRAEAGLPELSMSGSLCGIASVRAYEVSVSWSHTRPDGSGWQSVLSDYGFGYSAAAEELAHAAGYDGASVVSKWMGTESNSADLLNPAYTTVGVGIYSVGGTVYIAAILTG